MEDKPNKKTLAKSPITVVYYVLAKEKWMNIVLIITSEYTYIDETTQL
jgi:hypothetical protein